MARRRAVPRFASRLWRAAGMLVSREIAVLTNAIAFNFLLCLFPVLLVVAACGGKSPVTADGSSPSQTETTMERVAGNCKQATMVSSSPAASRRAVRQNRSCAVE